MDRNDKFREVKEKLGDPKISISQCILQQGFLKKRRQRKNPEKNPEKDTRMFLPRSYKVYERIFKLGESLLERLKKASGKNRKPMVLDLAGGCSNFVKEMKEREIGVVIADPVFFWNKEEIKDEILKRNFSEIVTRLKNQEKEYVKRPRDIISPKIKQIFSSLKESVKDCFLELNKFEQNLDASAVLGGYVGAELPKLPFRDGQFELVLVGHYMFSRECQNYNRCLDAIKECLRVGKEVRIFPIENEFTLEESPFLALIREELHKLGYRTKIYEADYELYPEKRHGLAIRHESFLHGEAGEEFFA